MARRTVMRVEFLVSYIDSYNQSRAPQRTKVILDASNLREAHRKYAIWLNFNVRHWWVKNPRLVRRVTQEKILKEKVLKVS